MMKIYLFEGRKRQYNEGEQPEGAVEVKPAKTKEKEAPANKSRRPKNK